MSIVNKTPIWFMRQAGRYLPEYQKIRATSDDFLKLCFNPLLASEISLQPIKRFDVDFIILFSDILVIPYALGVEVKFLKNHGPSLKTINSKTELLYQNLNVCLDKISNVFETIKILNLKKNEKKLIGFCGGPFTVLNYMIEGGTSKTHSKIKAFVREKKNKALDLIDILTEISIEYLKKQVQSGADYIQIFESWAGLLTNDEYEDFIIKPNQRITNEIKRFSTQTKIIHFPRGSNQNYLIFLDEVKCDVLSLDDKFPDDLLNKARKKNVTIQGNLNPTTLLNGGDMMSKEVVQVLEKFKNNKHIFNLSHGVLPKTKIDNIEKVIEIVRAYETSK